MSENEGSLVIPVPVKDAPYWRVLIRPERFEQERIATLKECWALMESCRVSLRGWDYPHVDRENRANGKDWIASWCEFRGHREYWRLYQSGQFVHLFSFHEDTNRKEADERARQEIVNMPADFSPSGYLEVIGTLYTITEIFEFATRLAEKGIFGDSLLIEVKMIGTKDRVLFVWNLARAWHWFYKATEDTLDRMWKLKTQPLISNSAELARDAVVWFFERFEWMDVPRELLVDEQRRFLERRI